MSTPTFWETSETSLMVPSGPRLPTLKALATNSSVMRPWPMFFTETPITASATSTPARTPFAQGITVQQPSKNPILLAITPASMLTTPATLNV